MAITRAEIEQLILECRLTSCFECGKCTASCPLGELFGDLTFGRSPRGIIEKALLDAELVTSEAIWHCLACRVCTEGCPSGVRFRDFIEGLRRLALADGHGDHAVRCKRCDRYFLPHLIHEHILARQKGGDQQQQLPEFLDLCPRCRATRFSERVKKSLPGRQRVPGPSVSPPGRRS